MPGRGRGRGRGGRGRGQGGEQSQYYKSVHGQLRMHAQEVEEAAGRATEVGRGLMCVCGGSCEPLDRMIELMD